MNKIPQIIWQISGGCTNECWYCLPKYRNNPDFKTIEEYLAVVDKLQNYGQRASIPEINWKFEGGEPIQFPNFNILLRQVKSKPGKVSIETSAGNSWFDILGVVDYLDAMTLTHHYWQDVTVLDYIIDLSKERNIELDIIVPLLPGKIKENRSLIQKYQGLGVNIREQLLVNEYGSMTKDYSWRDINLIQGRPEDWEPEPPPPTPAPVPSQVVPTPPVVKPDPKWVDPRMSNGNPSYTGKPCWAGVDWLYINSKGFAKGSECNGRNLGNVFDAEWTPPDSAFSCPMLFCQHGSDRKNIRIEA
jgi:organic radical activating enzyme